MAPEHNGEFGAWGAGGSGVLAGGRGGFGVEHNAEGGFGVLREGDGAGEEVSEAVDGKEIRSWVEEVYDHNGNGGGKSEGRDIGELGECTRGDS